MSLPDNDAPVWTTGLPTALWRALENAGIDTVGDLCTKSYSDLVRTKNIGPTSIRRIAEWMRGHGVEMVGYVAPEESAELIVLRERLAAVEAERDELSRSNGDMMRRIGQLEDERKSVPFALAVAVRERDGALADVAACFAKEWAKVVDLSLAGVKAHPEKKASRKT